MPGLVPAMAEQLKGGQPSLIAAHHLAIDQAGPHLEVVHRLDHEREAVRPVIASPGDQPDAHGVASGHQPIAVVLDLIHPARPGWRSLARGWQAGFDNGRKGHVVT
jgi:hypothetical protein